MAKKIENVTWSGGYNQKTGAPQLEHVIAKFEDGKYREWYRGNKKGIPKYVEKEVMRGQKAKKFFGVK